MTLVVLTTICFRRNIPDISGLIFGRYSFHVARSGKKENDVFDGRKKYCEFLKELDVQ